MKRRYFYTILCLVGILFSSCIKDLENEGVYESTLCRGILLDKQTQQPLQGFRVMGTDGWNIGNVVYTGADGSFEIAVTLEQLTHNYAIRFEADSLYENYEYSLSDVPLGTKEYDMGSIYLTGPSIPNVITKNVIGITAVSAHCFGSIGNTGRSTILQQGFVYSTMQYPTLDNEVVTLPVGSDDFDCELTLSPHTVYYVRAFAVNGVGVGYGEQIMITTLDGLANVSTGVVSNVTTTSATCGGVVSADGGFNVVARGVCWSTSATPTISNAHTVNGAGMGAFTSQIDNLEPNRTYHVRAYAQNSSGIAYGAEVIFTTQSGLPTVSTTTVSNVTATSAMAGGMVIDDGGYPVVRRGVCYGTSTQPTISGLHTTDGAGIGEYVSQLTGLTPGATYYYRAYATNGVGTVYGEQMVFVAW